MHGDPVRVAFIKQLRRLSKFLNKIKAAAFDKTPPRSKNLSLYKTCRRGRRRGGFARPGRGYFFGAGQKVVSNV